MYIKHQKEMEDIITTKFIINPIFIWYVKGRVVALSFFFVIIDYIYNIL